MFGMLVTLLLYIMLGQAKEKYNNFQILSNEIICWQLHNFIKYSNCLNMFVILKLIAWQEIKHFLPSVAIFVFKETLRSKIFSATSGFIHYRWYKFDGLHYYFAILPSATLKVCVSDHEVESFVGWFNWVVWHYDSKH